MRVRFLIALVGFLLLGAGAASGAPYRTCYTAKGILNGPPKFDWSAVAILDSLETTLKFTINCCGCNPNSTQASFYSNAEGLIYTITLPLPVNFKCPIIGTWKSTDPIPLTPARVTALKNGTMFLRLSKPLCSPTVSNGYLTAGSCDE